MTNEERLIEQNDRIISLLELIQINTNPTPGLGLWANQVIKPKEKVLSDSDKAAIANLKRRKDSGEDVESIAKSLGLLEAV